MDNLDVLIPIKEETIQPDEFVKIVEDQVENIESSTFIPPKIGSPDFGQGAVVYKHAVLKHAS